MPLGVIILLAVVAVIVVAILASGRWNDEARNVCVTGIDDNGLHLGLPEPAGLRDITDGEDAAGRLVQWSSIYEVTVITRRELGGIWYGFEVRSESDGLLQIDGKQFGEEFLSHTYRFSGFDHDAVEGTLRRRGSAVCYRR